MLSARCLSPIEHLRSAHAGSREALGQVLEACRLYLLGIAQRELDPTLRAKGGASDLVQQTFLEAQQDFGRFGGTTEGELLAWLRRLLLNNLANFARHYRGTRKRALGREVSLPDSDSAGEVIGGIPDEGPTPSAAFQQDEQYDAMQRALARLPEEYRQVIFWRYEQELSFDDIGVRLNRTANAARKLWLRAVERLECEMEKTA